VAFGLGTVLLLKRIPPAVRQARPEYELRTWARTALPLLFIAGINIVNMQTDILMLAALRGSESAGVYQAAVRGAELVAFSLVIANMAIQPSLARLYATGDTARLQRLVTWSARGATAAALPLAAVMILWGSPIMAAVFGADSLCGATGQCHHWPGQFPAGHDRPPERYAEGHDCRGACQRHIERLVDSPLGHRRRSHCDRSQPHSLERAAGHPGSAPVGGGCDIFSRVS
jgi:hypothetical protein